MVQLLCLGDHLLSLYRTGALRVWKIGSYDPPEVQLHEQNTDEVMLVAQLE